MNLGDPLFANDSLYQQKLNGLAERYSLETIPVSFDELTYFFTKVSNPGDVAVDLDSQGELLWQPYWAEDWESSRALCRLLLNRAIQGISILDLGCGLGLTGAVAASRGAKVILADNARPALEFSEINCWKWNHLCSYRELDWKASQSELEPVDLIVGAEIIYDSDDWIDLERFWRQHLKPDGQVWLCDPFRRTGKEFRDWIRKKNWDAVFQDLNIPEFEKPVNVVELSLN